MTGPGTVYLLHFDRPIGDEQKPTGYAQHYTGWTAGPLGDRLATHQAGAGARIMAAVVARGIPWVLARTWEGDRNLERRKKRSGSARRYCPVCRPELRAARSLSCHD